MGKLELSLITLVIISGCIFLPANDGQSSKQFDGNYSVNTSDGIRCGVEGVSFVRPESANAWDNDEILVGYVANSSNSTLFVAMINGSILGVGIQNSSGNEEINQDGLKIKLDKELNSEYNIRVVAFRDSNQNYKFDQNKDLPCIKENGELVQADMKVDFSKYN